MMERADDKRESMSRKRKEGKETFSFFFYFHRMKIRGTWMFLKWRGKKKYRDQSTVDGISAIRLKGIEMNIGSHDESSSLN